MPVTMAHWASSLRVTHRKKDSLATYGVDGEAIQDTPWNRQQACRPGGGPSVEFSFEGDRMFLHLEGQSLASSGEARIRVRPVRNSYRLTMKCCWIRSCGLR